MAVGPIVAPVLRSMTSKTVPLSERGILFPNNLPIFNFELSGVNYWGYLRSHIFLQSFKISVLCNYKQMVGTTVAQWLRCCATNRKVAGLIPAGVIGIFH